MPVPEKERQLIRRIRKMAGHPGSPKSGAPRWRGIVQGIGDDCAILRPKPGYEALVTTDFSLEGVHFRSEWYPAGVVGYRCLVRGLSDIAAMGGEPVAAFLSLALPKNVEQGWVNGFLKGLLRLARRYGVTLAGGDVAQSPGGILADIVVVGEAPKGEAMRRSGAKVGDGIYVSGWLGRSAAELRALRGRGRPRQANLAEPRIAVGQALRGIASACIDISDGLSTDLSHICEESRVGAVIEAEAVPVAKGATPELALHGGDDYELLFTAAQSSRSEIEALGGGLGIALTRVGAIQPGDKLVLLDTRGAAMPCGGGYDHFAS